MDARLEGLESMEVRLGEITEVHLRGPGKGNALGPAFWREAPAVARALDEDATTRVVVLRGSGACFTFGLDLLTMAAELGAALTSGARERAAILAQAEKMQAACEGWARCKKPVLAAVHGWCIGGGVNLIAACDVRLCSSDARFSLREVKIGLAPDLGALQRLPRIVGEGHARELALSGEDIDAPRAERIGLVNRVLSSPEALWAEARRIAESIAGNAPLAVQGVKQVMELSDGVSVADGLRFSAVWSAAFVQSEDFAEALQAFAERRPPRFQGK